MARRTIDHRQTFAIEDDWRVRTDPLTYVLRSRGSSLANFIDFQLQTDKIIGLNADIMGLR